ncbi:cytochrome P450 [Methylomonas sp. Kb3]|uniref:cytochrome P450 n=1 Tax=Methylomonas sp. Kb3 TaxID=1611544 RepID=UPI000C31EC02|nr:cytochrome P450 [Methylomonas sp. Kb3]PKD41027.1 cytochrome P450 [Methylomonas sp. Kb3]
MENSTLLNRSKKTSLPEHSVLLPMMQLIWRPLATLAGIHKQYGELVLGRLLGRYILFVCDPEYIEQIFNLEGKGQLNRNFLYGAKKSLFGNGLVNSESQVWSKQRRLMQPLFTKDTVKNYELIMVEEAAAMAEELKKAASGQVDLSTEIKRLIQRIFIRILLGKSVDQLSNGAELIKVIEIICQELPVQLGSEIVLGRRLKRFIPLKSKRYLAAVNYLQTFIGAEIAQTRTNPGQSLISQLMQASDRSTGYTMPDNLLQDEAVNLFFAGQETTINTLVWFFYLTGRHPEVRDKIAAEIRSLPNETLSAAHLGQLSYTKAALNETLRLYPPTSALSTQTIQDIELGDYAIPAGTIVLLSMHTTHHSARLWDSPDAFNPDRFLETATPGGHKYAFFPFGGGLHNCIGRHFAELEMLLVIASFFKAFTFETDISVKEAFSVTLKPDRPVVGRVEPIG